MYSTRPDMIEPYNRKSFIRIMCTFSKFPVHIHMTSGVESVPSVQIQFT